MPLHAQNLVHDLTKAAVGVFAAHWPDVCAYAESEFKKLAETLLMIERLRGSGSISEEQRDSCSRCSGPPRAPCLSRPKGSGLLRRRRQSRRRWLRYVSQSGGCSVSR
jgi:hypothetical protein